MSLLEARDLNVWFDLDGGRELHAVRGIDLAVSPGERLGLVGESGCGKTTTALTAMGLLPSSASVSGQLLIDGEDLLPLGEEGFRTHRWRDVAMVFQGAMNAFNPVHTVGSQIAEPMAYHRIASGRAGRTRVGELLELVGIPASAGARYPHEFSGGMRQRAAIAMALACKPKVLLADEPTTALDVMVQAQILELLVDLSADLGLALVLVTHDLAVVAQTCDAAAVMYAGEIVEQATMEDLYHRPRHPYTRALFAATPDLYGDEPVTSIPGSPPNLSRELIGCPFRPRCPDAFDRCAVEAPALQPIPESHDGGAGTRGGHIAACHLVDVEVRSS